MKDLQQNCASRETPKPQSSGSQQGQATVYAVYFPGESGAGLRSYTDVITIHVESGDPGGEAGDFQKEMGLCLEEWFDGAKITLVEQGSEACAGLAPLSSQPKKTRLDDLLEAATSAADLLCGQCLGSPAYERGIALRLALERLK